LTGYVTVSDFAFAFNDNITTIYSGHDVINIGSYTFIGCNSLSKAVINNPNYIIFAGEGSFDNTSENLIINVPKPLLQDYLSNEFWAAYTDNIDIPETEIIFNSLGGSACPNGTVKYYDYLSLSLPTRQHYTFEGWYSEQQNGVATRQLYDSTTIWSSLEETVTLYAKWEPVEYLITMYPNGGELILFYYIIR
jgi:uncharacterized repeat protein (TIGR02543 family)